MATPEEQEATMIARLEQQTGRPLEGWTELLGKSGKTKHGEIVKLLKSEHGVTHGYANLIAHKMLRSDAASTDSGADLVERQYAGTRAVVRPLYDAIMEKVSSFGEVEIAPKKTYVSLRRSKQFALLQPAASRLDVGINLKGEPPTDRLEASGSFNAMVSHRVRVTAVDEVDGELIGWLHAAWERA